MKVRFKDIGNGKWDDNEQYTDNNKNGKWDEGEPFKDIGNGKVFKETFQVFKGADAEPFNDLNGLLLNLNGQCGTFQRSKWYYYGVWDEGEDFED